MKTFKTLSIALFLIAALFAIAPAPATAQTALAKTTLSQAISGANPSDSTLGLVGGNTNSLNAIVFLAACNQTDMVAFNRVSNPVKLYMDKEAMNVQTVNSTTCAIGVMRGADGTSVVPHAASSTVYLGTPDKFASFDIPPGTACTAGTAADLYTPRINTYTGTFEDCVNGKWVINSGNTPGLADPQVSYDKPYTALSTFAGPNSVAVNEATDVNGQFWFAQIFIPTNMTLKGACQLNGNGTLADKMMFVLWDKSGTAIANTATAGVTQSGTSVYQCQDFTATVQVYGPQTYFIGAQGNGTTAASLALYASGSAPTSYLVGTQSGTFGTVANISSLPTSFSANKGPIMSVYGQ